MTNLHGLLAHTAGCILKYFDISPLVSTVSTRPQCATIDGAGSTGDRLNTRLSCYSDLVFPSTNPTIKGKGSKLKNRKIIVFDHHTLPAELREGDVCGNCARRLLSLMNCPRTVSFGGKC